MKHTKLTYTLGDWSKLVGKFALLVLGLGALTACVLTIQPPNPDSGAATSTTSAMPVALDPLQQYAAALQDAKVAEPDEIFNDSGRTTLPGRGSRRFVMENVSCLFPEGGFIR